MAQAIVELLVGLFELLLIVLFELLPALCYLTAVILVPAATFGKVAVQYPRNPSKPRWGWQNSIGRYLQGRRILPPNLGTVIGFSFWGLLGTLAMIVLY